MFADDDDYPAKFIHQIKAAGNHHNNNNHNNRNVASLYRIWYKQLRETDAVLHSRPSFLSAIVPTITPTNGDRSKLPHPAMIENSRTPFMAKEITDYIQKTNVTHWLKYSAKNIHGRTVNVHIMHCDGSNGNVPVPTLNRYKSYVYKIYAWFHFIHPYVAQDNDCSKTISLYFYFTPFKKLLPRTAGQTLGQANANTGFTYSCGSNPFSGGKKSTEIIIFRHQEWFKVLLHETLHNLELDFNTHVATSLRDIFPGIRHGILLSEAYVETWARLLNAAFYVFYDIYGGNGTVTEYNVAIQRCLSAERVFSLFQADKTLKYMGLSLSELIDRDPERGTSFAKKYSEATNIFAYYILAGMMVFAADEFIEWCLKTNKFSLIQAPVKTKKEGDGKEEEEAGKDGAVEGPAEFKKLIDHLSKSERMKQATLEVSKMKLREKDNGDDDYDYDDDDLTMRMTLWH
jgi:hypothetical protein